MLGLRQTCLFPSLSFSTILCQALPRSEAGDKEEASWLHLGATERAGAAQCRGSAGTGLRLHLLKTVPLGHTVPTSLSWSGPPGALTSCSVSTMVCKFMRLASSSSHLQEPRRTGGQTVASPCQSSPQIPCQQPPWACLQAGQARCCRESLPACPPGAPSQQEGDSQVNT